MRIFLILFSLCFCTSLHATPPEYSSSRKWVEQRCITNTTPEDERLFLGRVVPHEYAAIIPYHEGITIREIIDQTPFKGTTVNIIVLRPHVDPLTNLMKVEPTDKPSFKVKALDTIWICDGGPLIW
jgi:hypothetical protein